MHEAQLKLQEGGGGGGGLEKIPFVGKIQCMDIF